MHQQDACASNNGASKTRVPTTTAPRRTTSTTTITTDAWSVTRHQKERDDGRHDEFPDSDEGEEQLRHAGVEGHDADDQKRPSDLETASAATTKNKQRAQQLRKAPMATQRQQQQ